ncbi:MAG: hypothetical protein ACK5O2_03910 [Microthrixaceae bacterium]
MESPRRSVIARAVLALAVLVPAGVAAGAAASPAAPGTPAVQQAASVTAQDVTHRRDDFGIDLISRTYNPTDDNWRIVAEATLSSNRICLPLVFNCIVSEVSSPANADLTELSCDSPSWNHLLVFRNHCMKQLLFAGHDQKFTFTWTTDPGVNSGTFEAEVEFGRGVLPVTFQQLATATLTVDLGVALEVNKTCPTEVDAGDTLTCEIGLSYPATPGGGPAITTIELTDNPSPTLAALTTGGALTFDSGAGTWNCTALVCNNGTLANGESATFSYTAAVNNDPEGGNGDNTVSVTSSVDTVTSSDTVTVIGTGDTTLEIAKSTEETEANPGGPITWTVTVTNAGPLAGTDVLVSDIVPAEVDDAELTYSEGVGDWTCTGASCSTASMPVGAATFEFTGTVAAETKGDTSIVNEVGVSWENDILGPDFPITAGSVVPVVAGATTTTTATSTPATQPIATVPPGSRLPGVPLSMAG